VGAELARLAEERNWLLVAPGGPGPQARSALAAVDARGAELAAAAGYRLRWLDENRAHIDRWVDLTTAIGWREAAIGRGSEIRPTVAVASQIGLPPAEVSRRPAWRQAAEAIEVHREWLQLPDEPMELPPAATAGQELAPGHPDGERRVLAAVRRLEAPTGAEISVVPR
jgi:hypothetical protein